MILLFVAGGVLGAAGLLALGFGIPIKDTTFGSAMLLSSMVLLCTSLLLVGLGLVVRELKAVVRALAQGGVRVTPRGQPGRPAGPQRPALPSQAGLAPYVDPGAPPLMAEPSFAEPQPAASTVPPPWAAEAAVRDRARNVAGSQQGRPRAGRKPRTSTAASRASGTPQPSLCDPQTRSRRSCGRCVARSTGIAGIAEDGRAGVAADARAGGRTEDVV